MGSLVYLGSLIMFIGTIWLVVVAIQSGKTTGEKVIWALVNFFCQPLGGIVFFIVRRVGLVPMILVIIGAIIAGIGYPAMISEMMKNMPK